MYESILFTTNLLLGPTQIVNIGSATAVLLIGYLLLGQNHKAPEHRLAFVVAASLAFWAYASTLADVMHAPQPALFWTRVAILGPYFFGAFFLLFAYFFPQRSDKFRTWKGILVLLPSVAVCFLVATPLNVVEIRLVDWGTDFIPGPLYPIGILYLLVYLGLAAVHFIRSLRQTTSILVRRQIKVLLLAIALQTFSMIFTNALLPILFNYTQASVIGPASSLFFVLLMTYAIIRHHLLNVRVIATELLVILLGFLAFIGLFSPASVADAFLRAISFFTTVGFGLLLVRSVYQEVHRREEIQRLAEDLRIANVKLQELSEMKSNFISIASHQLRAPIGGVRAYLSMLREGDYGKLGKKLDDVLDLNLDTLNHTLHVIETFLNVTRIEAGKMDLNKEPVDLCIMTREIYKELALTASRKKIRLVFSCPQKNAMVRADKEKLRNVLFNLVENALKYTEHGIIKTTINVGSKRVEMRVTDTGIGIAPEEVPKLFAKFVRAGGGLKISHGSGLGLYIVKTLIEAHGGEAFVESPGVGKGSTFGFRMSAGKVR
ncbi:MAG: ATP-binding protein [Patescibacteria group bacterium]